jgi:hypothetical protein
MKRDSTLFALNLHKLFTIMTDTLSLQFCCHPKTTKPASITMKPALYLPAKASL